MEGADVGVCNIPKHMSVNFQPNRPKKATGNKFVRLLVLENAAVITQATISFPFLFSVEGKKTPNANVIFSMGIAVQPDLKFSNELFNSF
jgi:hypothetical protein